MVCAVRSLPIDIQCYQCRRWYNILVNRDDLQDYFEGEYIQNALSYLSQNERELLLSQTCGECFDKMFPPDLDNN